MEADSTHDMTVTNNNQSINLSPLIETEASIRNMTEYNVAPYR